MTDITPQMPLVMPPQHVQAYKDACDNLMYLKREQLQTTYYTWLLLAALYILAERVGPNARSFLLVGVGIVGFISLAMLWSYQRGMNKFRERLSALYLTYFPDEAERNRLRLGVGDKDYLFVSCFVTACLAATLFTLYLIENIPITK